MIFGPDEDIKYDIIHQCKNDFPYAESIQVKFFFSIEIRLGTA